MGERNAGLEDVIYGLKCIKGDIAHCSYCNYSDSNGCRRGNRCEIDCVSDAIELIESYKPRVLTLEEVRDEAEIVYIEERSQTTVWISGPFIIDNGESDKYHIVFVESLDGNRSCRCSGYGRTWRCWTARPHETDREGNPWEK